MTYKNIKFDDSPVMRSLEKLAVKKGLVKPEELTKTAAAKASPLKPTRNLDENILKLCAALRDQGFATHASEVESKFFNLKRAQTLYDTHGETGEDVINSAHPEGSHQMKGVEGDAMIETILDKRKAIENMLHKAPTGKQAAARDMATLIKKAGRVEKQAALNAVKIILAESPGDAVARNVAVMNGHVNNIVKIIKEESQNDPTVSLGRVQAMLPLSRLFTSNQSFGPEEAEKAKQALARAMQYLQYVDPSERGNDVDQLDRKYTFSMTSYGAWTKMLEEFNAIKTLLAQTSEASGHTGEGVSANDQYRQFTAYAKQSLHVLDQWKSVINVDPDNSEEDKKGANAWLDGKKQELTNFLTQFENMSIEEANTAAPGYLNALNKMIKDFGQFKKTWIGV